MNNKTKRKNLKIQSSTYGMTSNNNLVTNAVQQPVFQLVPAQADQKVIKASSLAACEEMVASELTVIAMTSSLENPMFQRIAKTRCLRKLPSGIKSQQERPGLN